MLFWPLVQAIVIQGIAVLCCSGYRDGGGILHASLIAAALFWLCVIAVVIVGPTEPSRIQTEFVRWGLIPFVLLGTPVVRSLASQLPFDW